MQFDASTTRRVGSLTRTSAASPTVQVKPVGRRVNPADQAVGLRDSRRSAWRSAAARVRQRDGEDRPGTAPAATQRAGEQGLLFDGNRCKCPPTSATAARRPAPRPASPTASSTTGRAPGWSSPRVRPAHGSGTQRLYGFRDILVLKVVKRLLDTGVSLQQHPLGRAAPARPRRRRPGRHHADERRRQRLRLHLARRGHRPGPGRSGRLRDRCRPGVARGRGLPRRAARASARRWTDESRRRAAAPLTPVAGRLTALSVAPQLLAATAAPVARAAVSSDCRRLIPAWESPRQPVGAPKEQPPRNLSGTRTARARQLWKAGASPCALTEGASPPQGGEALRSDDRRGSRRRAMHGRASGGSALSRCTDRPLSELDELGPAVSRPPHRARRRRPGQDARRRRLRLARRPGRRGRCPDAIRATARARAVPRRPARPRCWPSCGRSPAATGR